MSRKIRSASSFSSSSILSLPPRTLCRGWGGRRCRGPRASSPPPGSGSLRCSFPPFHSLASSHLGKGGDSMDPNGILASLLV